MINAGEFMPPISMDAMVPLVRRPFVSRALGGIPTLLCPA
jgi:hypothetical protein